MSNSTGNAYHYISDGTPASAADVAMVEKSADPPMGQGFSDGDVDGPEGGGDQDAPANGGSVGEPFSYGGGGQGDDGNVAILDKMTPPDGVGNTEV
jgi:hypothetical protein